MTSSKDAYNIRIHTMGTNLFFVTTDHDDVTAQPRLLKNLAPLCKSPLSVHRAQIHANKLADASNIPHWGLFKLTATLF